MSDNHKYYYLKLKESYFDQDNIRVLESMKNGHMYSLIILKLYLKACKYDGRLMMTPTIPYRPDKVDILASVIGHDISHVRDAIRAGEELDLLTIVDGGDIWCNEIQNFIGQTSNEGERKAIYRQKLLEEKKAKAFKQDYHIPYIDTTINNKRYGGNYYVAFERDEMKCRLCGKNDTTIVMHHIDGYDENKPENNDLDKLITLCQKCHRNVHAENISKEILLNKLCPESVPGVSQNRPPELERELESKRDLEKEKDSENHCRVKLDHEACKRIIRYLNDKTGKNFKSTTKSTQSHMSARFKEGFEEKDFIAVIDTKVKQWGDDDKMKAYLRPITLFGTKFESYLNENGTGKQYQVKRKFCPDCDAEYVGTCCNRCGWSE